MGIFDKVQEAAGGDGAEKAKDFVNSHEQQVDSGVEKAGDALDSKTGNKFSGQVDKGQQVIEDRTGNL